MSSLAYLLSDCVAAGVVFHRCGKKLRTQIGTGVIDKSLRARIVASSEELRDFFDQAFDWPESERDAESEGRATREKSPSPLVGSFC